MKKEKSPHFLNVKYEVKNFFYQEKYRQYIKGRKHQFDKQTIYYVIITTMNIYLMLSNTILCTFTFLR